MGVPRSTVSTLAGALAAPLLLLAACGGDDTSVADPPISPGSTTSSPTQEPQQESAEHFIRRFVSASNAMEARGGTQDYLALTMTCKPCHSLAKQIEMARSNGGFYRSRGWTIRNVTADVTRRSGTVDVAVTSAPTSFQTSAGEPVRHYSGGDFTFRVAIRMSGSVWKVTNVVQVAA